MRGKKTKFLSYVIVCIFLILLNVIRVQASTTLSSAPSAKVEYGYSGVVEVGTIRYISQISSSGYFNSTYWGGWTGQAGIECGTASISMALSYIGINKTPQDILDAHGGITYFGENWGGASWDSPSLSTAISNYVNGAGKYSPPVIYLQYYGSSATHWVIIAGKVSENVYQIVDPASSSVWNMTINGNTASYSKCRNGSETITRVYQYHNPAAVINNDTEAPVISNVQITDVSVTGYTVTCTVTDNVGVTSVKFPTWPSATGSWDPPVWHEGTISGNTASCRINVSEHGNMVNMNYATHIYAYDAAGNRGWSGSDWVFIDGTAPEIKDVEVTDISEQGYTITCTVTDNIGIDRVQFPTWTIYNDQDDIDTNWQNSTFSQGKISESTVTYRVNTSDHNNEKGNYCTHIYVYDKHGNYTVRWLEIAVGKESVASTARREYKGHVYMLYDEGWGWTWTQAKSYCSSLGGHLATITSEEEQRIIEELLEEGSREYYWLGATDEMVEGDWQWVTGEEFAYTNWADTQPDNYNTTEHYLVAYNDAAIRGLWNDVPERVGYGFICEIDGPEEFIITFDVNGGEPLANSTLNLTHESVNVSLPIPTRNGYVFEGWFDAREGGSKVTSIDQPTSDRVLYAQWTVQSGTEPHVHNYERTIAKDATCMEAGMAAYICSGCNDQYTEEIPALGHEWDNGQVTRKASCTEVGIMTYTCRRCGEIHTEELPASDHGGATVLKFEKKATCTVDGYSGDTYCVECGKLLEIGTVVPAAGHQWNEGVVVQEATNTSDGLKIYTCNVCGTSKKEIIKAAGENSKPDPATPQPGIPEKPTVTVGMTVQDTGSGGVYKVTGSGTAVEFVKPINAKKKAVTVPNTIVVNGVTCKVTSIAAKAFKGNKTLTKVTIPSNIKSIGKQAFFGCKKLKSITIKTKLLTSKTVGSKAFKGIYAKVTVKVPKNKRKAYKTLLKSKGVDNKAKFK